MICSNLVQPNQTSALFDQSNFRTMKRIFAFMALLNFLLLGSYGYSQSFELNNTYPWAGWISQLDTLDHTLVAHAKNSGGSIIYKLDSIGNIVMSNDEDLYTGGPHGSMKVKNNKVFFHAFVDQCDYYDNSFFIYRYDSTLQIERAMSSFEWEEQDNPFYNVEGPHFDSRFIPINDSIIAIASFNRFVVVNMNVPEVLVNMDYPFADVYGLYSMSSDIDSVLVYGYSGIFLFNENTISTIDEGTTYWLENYNGAFYRRGGGIEKLDSAFNVLASSNLSPTKIQFNQGLLYCKYGNDMYILNEDLDVVNIGNFGGLDNFGVIDFCKYNEQFYLGGLNGCSYFNEGSTASLKNYSLDFETEHFSQDIGITDINVVGHNFYPEAIFQGNIMNYNLHLSVDVTVTNFTNNPVSNANVVWRVDPYDPFGICDSDLRYFDVDTIAPNGSTVLHINDAFYRNQTSPGNGNYTDVEVCMASHAPDNKVDDFRNNDSYCETFNLLFVGIDESKTNSINCFYNSTQDQIEIRNLIDAQSQLYSSSGQLLWSQKLLRGDNQIPMDEFTSGIYLVRIETKDGVSVVKVGKP